MPSNSVWTLLEALYNCLHPVREIVAPAALRLQKILLALLPVGVVICFILAPGLSQQNRYADLLELFIDLLAACITSLISCRTRQTDPFCPADVLAGHGHPVFLQHIHGDLFPGQHYHEAGRDELPVFYTFQLCGQYIYVRRLHRLLCHAATPAN